MVRLLSEVEDFLVIRWGFFGTWPTKSRFESSVFIRGSMMHTERR